MNTSAESIGSRYTASAIVATLLFAGVLAMILPSRVSATEGSLRKPTIVLVHGAFAESSSWNDVISRLLSRGYPVVAAANPLRGVKKDADVTASLLRSIAGPIVLVGHSYGGTVITNAANGNSHVKALVYVAAFAPDAGETAAELSGRYPGSTLGPTLTPPVALPGGEKDLYIQQDKLWAQFAADIPEAEAQLLASTQRPITEAALNEPSGAPAWKTIPSWFVFGDLDRNIPAAALSFMARRAGARESVEIKGASHVPMLSHPDEVAGIIERAASGCKNGPLEKILSGSGAGGGASSPDLVVTPMRSPSSTGADVQLARAGRLDQEAWAATGHGHETSFVHSFVAGVQSWPNFSFAPFAA